MTWLRQAEWAAGVPTVALATVEATMPDLNTWWERLGVMGVLCVFGVALGRWFMSQLERKDQVIIQLTEAHAKSQKESTEMIVKEMQASHEVKRQVAQALDGLRAVIAQTDRTR